MTRLFELPALEEPAPHRAAPRGPLVRVALLVAYDGSGFHGFAPQPGARTVGGELAAALGRMASAPVEVVCAGRTDAGVHASAQVVHADVPARLLRRRRRGGGAVAGEGSAPGAVSAARAPGDTLRSQPGAAGDEGLCWMAQGLTKQLGPEIVVRAAALAPEGFDARHSALARRYRYLVLNTPQPDPLLARTTWHVAAELDLGVMRLACDVILGEHDFTAFCRRAPGTEAGEPIRRRVLSASWRRLEEPAGVLRFDIEAAAFCHQMVRALVGAHVAAGHGRLTAADVGALLRTGSRQGAPAVAPAGGLCLAGVTYPPELGLPF